MRHCSIIICLFFIFFSCKEDKTLSFSEIKITSPNNNIVEVNIPHLDGNNEVSNQINTEIQNTVITSLHIGEPEHITSKTVEESITAFNEEYNSFEKDFPGTEQPWEAQVDGDIMFQSPEIISIAITSYVNTGGAHGILNITILNFNAETGNSLKNTDLIKDQEAFKTISEKHFKKTTKNKDLLLDYDSFEMPANMGYSKEGIVLLYNTYEVAPYSTGIIQFTIPFEEVKDVLNFNSF